MPSRGVTIATAAAAAVIAVAIAAGAVVNAAGDRMPAAAPVSASTPAIVADGIRLRFDPRPLAMPDGATRPVRSLLETRGAMRFGDFGWSEEGVPPGPVWVRVDLSKQLISVFRGEHEIGTAVILYGTDGKPTPTGNFPILARAVHHRSSLYDAEMPYMLRLTHDGVAIHASAVQAGAATHGCIGVPEAFARHLYGAVRRGDPVAILPA
jgi:lipoprotein-anchoring transpeptidase ErfK/SrfK